MRKLFITSIVLLSLLAATGCGSSRKGSFDAAKESTPHAVHDNVWIGIQRYDQDTNEMTVEFWIRNDDQINPYTIVLTNLALSSEVQVTVDGRNFSGNFGANRLGGSWNPLNGFNALSKAREISSTGKITVDPGKTSFFDMKYVIRPEAPAGNIPFTVTIKGDLGGKPMIHVIEMPGKTK